MPRIAVNMAYLLSCLTLVLLLGGCQLFAKAELTVAAGPYLIDGEAQASVAISNTGARYSQLSWRAFAADTNIRIEPNSGMLRATESIQIRVITADGSAIPVDTEVTVTAGSSSQSVTLGGSAGYYCLRDNQVGPLPLAHPAGPQFAPGQLLVRYQHVPALLPASLATSFQQIQSASVRAEHQLTLLSAATDNQPELISVAGDLLEAARQLELDPRVLYAEPNYYLHLLADPGDCTEEQWHLARFGIPEAWRQREGTSPVVVAVIDSGVDIDHPELRSSMLPGYRFTALGNSDDPRPGQPGGQAAHGTHVTGIISGLGNNDLGVIGAAPFPAVRVLPIRIFDDTGKQARMSDLIMAINWALGKPVSGAAAVPPNPYPAAIINLSLGMNGPSSEALNEVLKSAAEHDALVLAAAGNIPAGSSYNSGVYSPANSPFALAVGSVNWDFQRSSFSEYGGTSGVALMAPGGSGPSSCRGVLSTIPEGNYACMQGTSMATPFVSAVAALILTREPGLSAVQLQERLEAATHYSATMNQEQYGSGVLCAERAIANSNPRPDQPCQSN